MHISILTLLPKMFSGPFEHSIIKRAQEKNLVELEYVNIRDFADDRYKTVDDRPYGGGIGMVMKVDVLHKALSSIKDYCHSRESGNLYKWIPGPASQGEQARDDKTRTVLLDPKGKSFNQQKAQEYSRLDHLILICGHYEGVDARIEKYIDESLSIGPYVLTGGELPAMVVTDSVVRLVPGVLPAEATTDESLPAEGTLEYPQYTRPEEYEGAKVPETLLSGDHKKIEAWRKSNKKRLN